MKIRHLLFAAGCAALLCGCTKSNIVTPETEAGETLAPDFNLYAYVEIDEDQLHEDVDDIYLDEEEYPMAYAIDFGLHLDDGYVDVIAVVKDGTSAEDASEFAMVAIKGVNDEYAMQDFNYGSSDETMYGGLYQDNEIHLKVYTASEYENDGDPWYEMTIPEDEYILVEIPED
ncbi:MAG: hypothetical protein LUC99_09430 [Clostridiales bacterium]|nr:hypothetical protein [Clostridiales bacterium]